LAREDFDSDEDYAEYLAIEASELSPDTQSADMLQLWRQVAETAINPPRTRISIAIPERTLAGLKARALAEGMPYQTLINSILHKWLHER